MSVRIPEGVESVQTGKLTDERICMMVNQKYLDKAEVLIEALPYIQRFNRKIIVVKYGGSAMVDEELKKNVIQDVVLLKLVGFKPIIVHGGGKEISRWVGKVGMEPKFINGLRVTDRDTMEVAEMVLNKVNKELVALIQSLGIKAVGISGKDGGLLKVEKKLSDGQDIGFVGDVKQVTPKVLYDLLEKDFLPVVCPIGMDEEFNSYNINDAMRLNFAKDRTVQVIYKGAELGTYPWSALYGYYTIEMDDEAPENVLITMEEDGSLSVQYSDDDDYLTFKCVKSAGEE